MSENDETAPEKKETIKEAFFRILSRETVELMEKTLTHKLIGRAFIAWVFISAATSIYRRLDNRCNIEVPLDKYFYARAICPTTP